MKDSFSQKGPPGVMNWLLSSHSLEWKKGASIYDVRKCFGFWPLPPCSKCIYYVEHINCVRGWSRFEQHRVNLSHSLYVKQSTVLFAYLVYISTPIYADANVISGSPLPEEEKLAEIFCFRNEWSAKSVWPIKRPWMMWGQMPKARVPCYQCRGQRNRGGSIPTVGNWESVHVFGF